MFLMKNPRGKSLNTYGSYLPQECQIKAPPLSSCDDCEECDAKEKGGNEHGGRTGISGRDLNSIPGNNAEEDNAKSQTTAQAPPPQTQTQLYLFIEEVLFLHERGLLEVYNDAEETNRLQSKHLFAMLPKLGVAFPVYLTYAHLRAQTYIVMRHAPQRLDIIDALAEKNSRKRKRNKEGSKKSADPSVPADFAAESATSESEQMEEKGRIDLPEVTAEANKSRESRAHNLKKRLRSVEFHAPAPILMRSTDTLEMWSQYLPSARFADHGVHREPGEEEQHAVPGACTRPSTSPLAFDVYGPNSAFKRTNPGRPDFCVAVASYAEASPGFGSIGALVSIARGVPVRVSTVADGGTVVMFSLTDYGVPPLAEIKAASLAGNGKKSE